MSNSWKYKRACPVIGDNDILMSFVRRFLTRLRQLRPEYFKISYAYLFRLLTSD